MQNSHRRAARRFELPSDLVDQPEVIRSEETSAFGHLVSEVTQRTDVWIRHLRVLSRQSSDYLFPIETVFFDDVIQLQECAGEIKLAYVTGKRIQLRLLDMTGESAL